MITKPTLFILGAGASIPYGFPSGAKLRNQICAVTDGRESLLASAMHKFFNIHYGDFLEFAESFQQSRLASIDSFLSRRTEFADIGKLAIASLLIPNERADVFNHDIEDDWYFALWNALVSNVGSIDELKKNNIQIYTFNYDRSLENYLHSAIINTFNINPAEALDVLANFKINHVYGSLGYFGVQHDYSNQIRAYTNEYNQDAIELAARSLRVIPEARADDSIFIKAKDAFLWAEHVCFLGFGFDPLNVERLGFRNLIYSYSVSELPHKVVASTFGLTDAEVDLIHDAVIGVKDFHDGLGGKRVVWDNFNSKNLMTLRRFAWLLK